MRRRGQPCPARLTAILLLFLGEPAAAQVSRSSNADPAVIEVVQALKDSQMVRSAALGLGRSQGRVLRRSDSVLVLATEGAPAPIRVPLASIDTLWVQGSNLRKGLAWGAGVGALAGLATGVLINQAFCQDSDSGCEDEDARVILLMGLVGLGVGTVSGAIIGALVPRWERRWP